MAKESKVRPYLLLLIFAVLMVVIHLFSALHFMAFVTFVPLFLIVDEAGEKSFLRRLGKVSIILFWLALGYLNLKANGGKAFFIADVIARSNPEWLRWTVYTGYFGASLWILVVNLFVYLGLFRKWQYAVVLVIVIVGPILYSYSLPPDPSVRMEPHEGTGEWIPRTAAWISVLILLSAFIKELIRKK